MSGVTRCGGDEGPRPRRATLHRASPA